MVTPIPQALLPSNPTRHELFRALPSGDTLHIMWTGWAIVAFVSAFASALIFLVILTAPAVRSNVFNLYLAALVLPDFFFSFCCGITCTINAAAPQLGIHHVPWMCELQSVYCIFGFVASPWMNALSGYEVCRLLHANKWARTYVGPTIKMAIRNAALVYLWAMFVATWTLIPGLPHRAYHLIGLACLPAGYDTTSEIFFWLVFAPAFLLVPLAFILVISVRAWKEGALQHASRARSLAVFYMRILMVFLLFWAPTVLLMYIVPLHEVWVGWAGGTWSHLQGLFSALLCLTKKDVQEAVRQLMRGVRTCACCDEHGGRLARMRSTRRESAWFHFRRSARVAPETEKDNSMMGITMIASSRHAPEGGGEHVASLRPKPDFSVQVGLRSEIKMVVSECGGQAFVGINVQVKHSP
uniref:G-protein coupled receptors family 1 profile domain-containing protein n=1 Tax=Chrysotila carterae TaxID=13221 RepID=A0A6S9TGT7_CHRCT